MAKNAATTPERLRLLLANNSAKDKAAAFLWPFLSYLWNFAADRIGEVADDAASIDAAMRAGFNWELGPFQMWDAAGVADTIARMKELQLPVSAAAQKLVEDGSASVSWYSSVGPAMFQPSQRPLEPVPTIPGHARVADFRQAKHATRGVLRTNPGASLVDLGDGIACIELHSLKNAIGGEFSHSSPAFSIFVRDRPRFFRLRHHGRPR